MPMRNTGADYPIVPFESGQPLSSQLTADRLNGGLDATAQNTVRWGRGLHGSRGPGGTTINRLRPRGSQSVSHPFKIYRRRDPSDPALFQAKIDLQSDILMSGKASDNLTCTGLDSWFPLIANDVLIVAITISFWTASAATIQSYGQGNTTFDPTLAAWDPSGNGYVFDDGGTPATQIGANLLLGYTTPDAQGNPYLVQAQFDHVFLEVANIDAFPALYDFSHRRRYGITAP